MRWKSEVRSQRSIDDERRTIDEGRVVHPHSERSERWFFVCLLSSTFGLLCCVCCLLIIAVGCAERHITEPTSQMDIASQFWVRVLLLDDIELCSFKSSSSFTVSSQGSSVGGVRFDACDMPIEIKVSQGTINLNGRRLLERQVLICPDAPYIFKLDGRDYRGKLKLVVNPDGGSLDAINLVPIEPYLAGVVGAEMPDYWEEQALEAQAIAARTYCLYIKNRFGSGRNWDVKKTESNQVYVGLAGESAQVWAAVNRTLGQVLVCALGQKDVWEPRYEISASSYQLFPAYYSSTCGGHTEDSRNVFGGDYFVPLGGVHCPYCRNVAKPRFLFWQARFDKTDVTEKLLKRYPKLQKLGQIKSIVADKRSDYDLTLGGQRRTISRLTMVKLNGSTGQSDFLRAEDLRLTIDPTGRKLKSTICKIVDLGRSHQTKNSLSSDGGELQFLSGRGYGHGVGMCQCGAEAMARQGQTAEQILSYYYPGSKILILDY